MRKGEYAKREPHTLIDAMYENEAKASNKRLYQNLMELYQFCTEDIYNSTKPKTKDRHKYAIYCQIKSLVEWLRKEWRIK